MAHIGTKIVSGKTEVKTEQTAVKLTESSTLEGYSCLEVQVQADPSNVGAICAIGDKNVNAKKELGKTQGLVLEKKQAPVILEIDDPSKLWIDAEKGKDFVIWTATFA